MSFCADPERPAPCYIIGEAGSNHDGKLERALDLIAVAAEAGCNAVKFQLFRAEKLYTRGAGESAYLGIKRSIYDIIRDMEMPLEWLPRLKEACDAHGIDFMASPFDEESLDLLDPFVEVHKCASYEMTHHPFLSHMARKKKPVILSTGTADLAEVEQAAAVVVETGNRDLVLLQCTASYPTPLSQVNVRAMIALAKLGFAVGLSDHSREPTVAPAAAVALGARVVEKHFTLANDLPGPDHAFAVLPDELAAMVRAIRQTEEALGDGKKVPLPSEAELRRFARRSIFTTRPVQAGEVLDDSNVAVLRCGQLEPGLPPAELPRILGRRARRALPAQKGIVHDDLAG